MKDRMKLLRVALLLSLSALCPALAQSATLDSFYSFAPFSFANTNLDGQVTNATGLNPTGGLVAAGNVLYGTAPAGGPLGFGTVYSIHTDGTGFTNLHSFTPLVNDTNSDGFSPQSGLILSNNVLYGTAVDGGAYGGGTVFSVNTDGSGFTTLHHFTGLPPDGENPMGTLFLSGNTLYGTAYFGGTLGAGSVFSVGIDGSNFTNVYNFTGTNDGNQPSAGVVLSGNTLYGTALSGGTNGNGTVFAVNTDGNGFTLLHTFSAATNLDAEDLNTNYDGTSPMAGLALSGNTLYGAATAGGLNGWGTLFAVHTNGSGFIPLHQFSAEVVSKQFKLTNSDGIFPEGTLTVSGSTIFGTASGGGAGEAGTVFSLNTDGSDFVTLTSFPHFPIDGDAPTAGVTLSGSTLYGMTRLGGVNQTGSLFSIALGTVVQGTVPMIIANPISQTNDAGTTVTLYVDASSSSPIKYQWRFNGHDISSATSQTLVFNHVTTANAGNYDVILSNSSGSVTSAVATVTVLQTPTIAKPPTPETEPPGGVATFSVTAAGGPVTYLWFLNGTALSNNAVISGVNSNQLTIDLVTSAWQGGYTVVISNSIGSITSAPVQLELSQEKTHPTVGISLPKSNSRSAAPVLSGTAFDSVRVAGVNYWVTNLNNGVVTTQPGQATLSMGSGTQSNWNVPAAILLPGTNILAVQSSNYSGLTSPVSSVSFFYQVPVPFQLQLNPAGAGTVTGAAVVKGDPAPANGASLYVGEGYTVTVSPGSDWWFTNWLENGSAAGSNPTLPFIMESNLVVTATFTSNLFAGVAGRYDGIFQPGAPTPATATNSGLINNLQLGSNGAYSCKLYLAGTSHSLSGAFNREGYATTNFTTAGGKVTLDMSIVWQSAPRQITGLVSNASGWVSTNLNLFAAASPGSFSNASNYTLLLPQAANASTTPPSYSYALLTNLAGMIQMGGALSDGSPFTALVEPVNEADQFPVYATPDSNAGLLLGELSLEAANGPVPAGNLTWFKPPQKMGLYSGGFDTVLDGQGSPWTNSQAALAGLFPGGEAALTLSGGNLSSQLVTAVRLTSTNTLQAIGGATNFSGGSLNLANGQLTITFKLDGKSVTGAGAVLQNTNMAGGFFPGAISSGTLTLTPLSLSPD